MRKIPEFKGPFDKEEKADKPEKDKDEQKELIESKHGKPEKEKDENKETKDEAKDAKGEKEFKDDRKETKLEWKETKDEGKEKADKDENKEAKDENKDAKNEIKDLKPEFKDNKDEGKEQDPDKPLKVEKPDEFAIAPQIDRETLLRHAESLEETARVLRHFIEQSERPDLRRGALRNEPEEEGGG